MLDKGIDDLTAQRLIQAVFVGYVIEDTDDLTQVEKLLPHLRTVIRPEPGHALGLLPNAATRKVDQIRPAGELYRALISSPARNRR